MKYISATDVGKIRKNNEDSYYVNDKNIFVLADGMGGHLAGEKASQMATDIIAHDFENLKDPNLEDVISIMSTSIKKANEEIFNTSKNNEEYQGMGTTASVGYIFENILVYANVGDSRIYKINEDIEQLTIDDSFVNYLIDIGEITKEEAKNHPKKNVLTKALGTNSDIDVMVNTLNLSKDDFILLCSDGLTNMVSDENILNIVKEEDSLEIMKDRLLTLALENGGVDNVTFILIKIQ